ncbi:MAG: phage terminase large subunit family protein [Spirochaetales bacterium]|nr:phage terminase large subunit family protein [Spirochaetales bacterium]
MKQRLAILLMAALFMGATVEKEFLEHVLTEGERKFDKTTLEEFLVRNIVVRDGAKYTAYDFSGHAPLRWITRKLAQQKHVVCMKAAQVGFSTWMIGRSLYLTNGRSMNVAFFFPNQQAMSDFVQYRIDPLLASSPYFEKMLRQTGGTDNIKIKQIGRAIYAFRSTSTMTGVKSFDSDVNIEDEVDEHNPEHLEFTRDRLLHSKFGYIMAGSQPSIDDYGIHAQFQDSSQSWWHVRCSCGVWNHLVDLFLSDPERLIQNGQYCCSSCQKPIDNQKGEFVAAREHEIAGIQLSQLAYKQLSPGEILRRYQRAQASLQKRKNFYISVIGVPFSTDDEKPISQAVLTKQRGDHGLQEGAEFFTYMGADQGDTVHMVFGEPTPDSRIRIIGLAKFSVLDEDAHCNAIIRFNTYAGLIDAMPNKNWAIRMALNFPEVVKIQYFARKFAERTETLPGAEDVDTILTNRDDSLQETVDAIRNGLFVFPDPERLSPSDAALFAEFEYHLKMLIRERGEDENGKPLYQFKKRVANHFGMALNSLRLAYEGIYGSSVRQGIIG